MREGPGTCVWRNEIGLGREMGWGERGSGWRWAGDGIGLGERDGLGDGDGNGGFGVKCVWGGRWVWAFKDGVGLG